MASGIDDDNDDKEKEKNLNVTQHMASESVQHQRAIADEGKKSCDILLKYNPVVHLKRFSYPPFKSFRFMSIPYMLGSLFASLPACLLVCLPACLVKTTKMMKMIKKKE
uniref:Uncharacterized protein n=1 Tax=Glossina pallidipes TaxID=7398 RepID=A0A1A9ZU18_GLOPL